ncbi:MAG: hypothetical protein GEU95_17015 [Rhizobiales bacterium]|nr:hypothetical protein [Hyphomicrobiales bacterium]
MIITPEESELAKRHGVSLRLVDSPKALLQIVKLIDELQKRVVMLEREMQMLIAQRSARLKMKPGK